MGTNQLNSKSESKAQLNEIVENIHVRNEAINRQDLLQDDLNAKSSDDDSPLMSPDEKPE